MNSCRLYVVNINVLLVMMLLFCIINDCNASRKTNVLETRPAAQVLLHQQNNNSAAGHFLHMLPKRKVPASAPSRKHNDLGLQTRRFP
ncbi:hypothetical protein ACP275_12G047300 [Erythranthe tilingii]